MTAFIIMFLFLCEGSFCQGPPKSSWGDFLRHRFEADALLKMELAWGSAQGRFQKLELQFDPEVQLNLPGRGFFRAKARLGAEAFDRLEAGIPDQGESSRGSRRFIIGDRVELELREFYLEIPLDRIHLSLGKQPIVWGQADGLKVLDLVNPQDFREFILDDFADSRIPLWSIQAEVSIRNLSWQIVWIPDRTYHRLPQPGSVFSFGPPQITACLDQVENAACGIDSTDLKVLPSQRPQGFFSGSDAGMMLSGFWKGWDWTLNYLYHYHDFPAPFREISPDGTEAAVRPRYLRGHLAGGSLSNAFGDFVLRGEAGLFLKRPFVDADPLNSQGVLQANEINYVLGLDFSGISETFISAQLFQSILTAALPSLIRQRAETTVTVLIQRDFYNDALQVETQWLQSVERGDGLLRAKIVHQLRGNLRIWTGYDLFYGDPRSLFGQFDAKDRLVVGFERGF